MMTRAMILLVALVTLGFLDTNMTVRASDTISVYFGTYTGGQAEGSTARL